MAATKSRSTGGKAGKGKAARTAALRERQATHRARMDRIAAEKRTRSKNPGETERPGFRRSVAEHSEHPETFADSTVRHAEPPTGKSSGEGQGGFPQGEYDVTQPASEPADTRTNDERLLDQHIGTQDIQKHLNADRNARLSLDTALIGIETLPVGSAIERETENRWRVRGGSAAGQRFGFGTTAREAIEAYILGDAVQTQEHAGFQARLKLSPAQQKEIADRNAELASSDTSVADHESRFQKFQEKGEASLDRGIQMNASARGGRFSDTQKAERSEKSGKKSTARKTSGRKSGRKSR